LAPAIFNKNGHFPTFKNREMRLTFYISITWMNIIFWH
jgi:hypothetical protein